MAWTTRKSVIASPMATTRSATRNVGCRSTGSVERQRARRILSQWLVRQKGAPHQPGRQGHREERGHHHQQHADVRRRATEGVGDRAQGPCRFMDLWLQAAAHRRQEEEGRRGDQQGGHHRRGSMRDGVTAPSEHARVLRPGSTHRLYTHRAISWAQRSGAAAHRQPAPAETGGRRWGVARPFPATMSPALSSWPWTT